MKRTTFFVLLITVAGFSCAQQKKPKLVGGPCEGCEAILEYGDRKLSHTDTLPLYYESSTHLKLTGTVYEQDGKTPAKGVILYVYHTNSDGIYPTRGDEKGWGRRHGYIRGWVKTDSNGKYEFYTFKPGSYPSRSEPAHVHLTILEPNGKYYWIGSYLFQDDPLLTDHELNPQKPRGGSGGVLKLSKQQNMLIGERNIILGKNVEGYE